MGDNRPQDLDADYSTHQDVYDPLLSEFDFVRLIDRIIILSLQCLASINPHLKMSGFYRHSYAPTVSF
jgi:hypothetical protein